MNKVHDHAIRVLVCADDSEELARLEAVIRAAPSLQFAGVHLGIAGLEGRVADSEADVLLAAVAFEGDADLPWLGGNEQTGPTVLLVPEVQFGEVLAAMRGDESEIRGVLPEWASDDEIVAAIVAAASGLLVVHPDVAGFAGPGTVASPVPDAAQPLTPREREILNLLATGLANKQIAWQLKISEHTVKFHVTSIFNKLNASTRAEAVAIAARQGLLIL